MTHCHAIVRTINASKYLQQLCKHFSHKVSVDFDTKFARVEFPGGLCLMAAEEEALSFYCRVDQPENTERMQSVLDTHLVKFAWREELTIEWKDGLPNPVPVGNLPNLQEITNP